MAARALMEPFLFEPSAYLIGSESRPTSTILFAISGGAERWLRLPLDLSKPAITYPRQALALAKKTSKVPFHGRCTGFVVNFVKDRAVLFDLHGDPIADLPHAYVPGHVRIEIAGKEAAPSHVAHVLGASFR